MDDLREFLGDAKFQRILRTGDRVRVHSEATEEWTEAVVVVASENGKSVGLRFDGVIKLPGGGLVANGLMLSIDYEKETITDLFGNELEMEVAE